MGFFSWKTSDTDTSISNSYSSRGALPVHMITEDGRVFTEPEYEGYGVFGGKDIYELIAHFVIIHISNCLTLHAQLTG